MEISVKRLFLAAAAKAFLFHSLTPNILTPFFSLFSTCRLAIPPSILSIAFLAQS